MGNPFAMFGELALVFLSCLAAPPPADAPAARPAAEVYAALPGDAWAVATFDLHALRADADRLLAMVDEAKTPALAKLPAPPRALLDAWRAKRVPDAAARRAMQARVDRLRRVHVAVHGFSGMGPGVGVVVEGVADGDAAAFAAWLNETAAKAARGTAGEAAADANADAAPVAESVPLRLNGRAMDVVATPLGTVVVAAAPEGRMVVANSLPLAKRLLSGLADPQADGGSLARRLADYGLEPPADGAKWAVFANLPEALPYAMLGDYAAWMVNFGRRLMNDDDATAGTFAPATFADVFLDLSGVGPFMASEGADGALTARLALAKTSEWRRWLGGKDFRHDVFADAPRPPLLALGFALGDAPGLAQAWSARWTWALGAMRWPAHRPPGRDIERFVERVENAAPQVTGEPLAAFAARLRGVGLRVDALDALPGAVPPAQIGLLLLANTAAVARFADADEPLAAWERIRQNTPWGKTLPAFGAPDADGVRAAVQTGPAPVPMHFATKGDRIAVSINPDKAAAAVRGAPGAAAAESGRGALDTRGAFALLRAAMTPTPGQPGPGWADFLPDALPEGLAAPVAVRLAVDDAGLAFVARGPLPAWVGGGAATARVAVPALMRARQGAQAVASLSNLRQLMVAFHLYAVEHDDGPRGAAFPPAFDAATLQEIVGGAEAFAQIVRCPASGQPYTLVDGAAGAVTARIPHQSKTAVLHGAPIPFNRGLVVPTAYADGHTELVPMGRFEEVLRQSREALREAGGDPDADANAAGGEAF